LEIFHLAFKQFTEYLQIAVFQFLDSMKKLSHFFAMNLRLNLPTAQHYNTTVDVPYSSKAKMLHSYWRTQWTHIALKYRNYSTVVKTLHAFAHSLAHLVMLRPRPLTLHWFFPSNASLSNKMHYRQNCGKKSLQRVSVENITKSHRQMDMHTQMDRQPTWVGLHNTSSTTKHKGIKYTKAENIKMKILGKCKRPHESTSHCQQLLDGHICPFLQSLSATSKHQLLVTLAAYAY